MIRQATVADAKSVLPIINIVFEEMEMPLFQKIPLEDLFGILEQAFAMPEYPHKSAYLRQRVSLPIRKHNRGNGI